MSTNFVQFKNTNEQMTDNSEIQQHDTIESYQDENSRMLVADMRKFNELFMKFDPNTFKFGTKPPAKDDKNTEMYIHFGVKRGLGVTTQKFVGPPLCAVSSAGILAGDFGKSEHVKELKQAKYHFEFAHTADPDTLEQYPVLELLQRKHLEFLKRVELQAMMLFANTEGLLKKQKLKLEEEQSDKMTAADITAKRIEHFCNAKKQFIKPPSIYCNFASVDFKRKVYWKPDPKQGMPASAYNFPAKVVDHGQPDEPDHIEQGLAAGYVYTVPKLYKGIKEIILGRNTQDKVLPGDFWVPVYSIEPFSVHTTGQFGIRACFDAFYFWRSGNPDHIKESVQPIAFQTSEVFSDDAHHAIEYPMVTSAPPTTQLQLTDGSSATTTSSGKNNLDDNNHGMVSVSKTGIFDPNQKAETSSSGSKLVASSNTVTNGVLKKRQANDDDQDVSTQPFAKKQKQNPETVKNASQKVSSPKNNIRAMQASNGVQKTTDSLTADNANSGGSDEEESDNNDDEDDDN